jgi:peptide deformylase
MIRPILRYGAPELHDVAAPVAPEAVTAPATRALIADLLETLREAHGVGLAAPQVGVGQRICVVDVSGGRRPEDVHVLVNPAFEARDGLQLELEGCLSLPGIEATVARPARVRVRHLDRDGRERTLTGDGLLARALQHEIDHLDGVLFVDRLPGIARRLLMRRLRRQRRREGW